VLSHRRGVGLSEVPDLHGKHCVHFLVNLELAPCLPVGASPLTQPANPALAGGRPPKHH